MNISCQRQSYSINTCKAKALCSPIQKLPKQTPKQKQPKKQPPCLDLGKAASVGFLIWPAPRHLHFHTRWSFVPSSPASGRALSWDKMGKGAKGETAASPQINSSGLRNSKIPARPWALTLPSWHSDFSTALFCHFWRMEDFNNSKSQSMLSSYQPLPWLQGTAWAHTTAKLHFFSPYRGTAFKLITRLHTWIAHWVFCIPLHIPSYFLSK